MKKTKITTVDLAINGLLIALIFILGLTPVGMIPLGFLNLTIIHIPVIVGTLTTKKETSIFLGFAFGLVSLLSAFLKPSALVALLLKNGILGLICVVVMSVGARLMIPVMTNLVKTLLSKVVIKNNSAVEKSIVTALSAIAGSLTNTVLYLGSMGLFFYLFGIWGDFASKILSVGILIAASSEALAAAIIAVPVVLAVDKTVKIVF